jgi:pyruvate dehydrogenase E1 component beta subunit
VTLVSFGIGMQYALEAAETLAAEGVSAEVVDLRSLRPIDYDTVLASVQKTNRCVTIEEGFPVGSIGNHLSATIMEKAFDYLDAPVINCTGKDVPYAICGQFRKTRVVDHPRGDRGRAQSNLQVRKTELCQLKFSCLRCHQPWNRGR